VSTQERAVREGGAAQHDAAEGEAAAGGAASGFEPARLRAMQRRWVQRKKSGRGGGAAAIPTGPGAPLGGGVQSRMEHTLGAGLGDVRVHTGGDSAEAAEELGARAFTVGSDVHFGRGEFAPGSKEGDRLLAHELTHVVQGQKSGVQRKPAAPDGGGGGEHADAAHGDHETGGHEVSEPGDAPEKEADAMGDHAAEQLHGGDGAAGGEHAHGGHAQAGAHGATAAGEKVAGESSATAGVSAAKPKISAGAPGLGRKIQRAKNNKPTPPPTASGGKAAPNKTGAASSSPAKAGAPAANALSAQDQQKVDGTKKTLEASQVTPGLKIALEGAEALITKLAVHAQDPAVAALKATYDAKKAALEDAFDKAFGGASQAMLAIKVDQPNAFALYQAAWKNPVVDQWAGLAMFSWKDRPAAVLFKQTRDAQERAIRDHHREKITKATQDVRSTPNEPDPAKPTDNPAQHIDAIFEGVRPWMNALGGANAWEQVLQDTYISKKEQIAAATVAQQAKQVQQQGAAALKEKSKHQSSGAAASASQTGAAASGGAAATSSATNGAPATGKPTPDAAHAPPTPQPQAKPATPTAATSPTPATGHAPLPKADAAHGSVPPASTSASAAHGQPQTHAPADGGAAGGPIHADSSASVTHGLDAATGGDKHGHDAATSGDKHGAGHGGDGAKGHGEHGPEGNKPGAHNLTPEEHNKLEQLEVMLEIASAEAADSANAFNVGATIVANLATAVNPGFILLALGKSGGVMAAKLKHEFETKVGTKMLKDLPPEEIDRLLLDWSQSAPDFERALGEVRASYGKTLSAKEKIKAGGAGSWQLVKDDWKEILVEGMEGGEHLVEHLPSIIEQVAHALPFLGIGASIWGVISNVRKVKAFRKQLAQLQEKQFGPGGQPVGAAASSPPSGHH